MIRSVYLLGLIGERNHLILLVLAVGLELTTY